MRGWRGEQVGQRATDDLVDQFSWIGVDDAFGRHAATIAKDCDPICDSEDFIETMCDVYNSDAVFPQPS